MHFQSVKPWQHSHSFGQEKMGGSETRVRLVVLLTARMMVWEIAAGIAFGSMALLANALTSFLAIFALLSAKYFGANWMDPLMGMVGAALVTPWSGGLLRSSGAVLLDWQAPAPMLESLRGHLERDRESRVADLHLWSIAPGAFSAAVSVVTDRDKPPASGLPEGGLDLEAWTDHLILRALEKNHWNQSRTARYLNVSRNTLVYRMEKRNLKRAGGKP